MSDYVNSARHGEHSVGVCCWSCCGLSPCPILSAIKPKGDSRQGRFKGHQAFFQHLCNEGCCSCQSNGVLSSWSCVCEPRPHAWSCLQPWLDFPRADPYLSADGPCQTFTGDAQTTCLYFCAQILEAWGTACSTLGGWPTSPFSLSCLAPPASLIVSPFYSLSGILLSVVWDLFYFSLCNFFILMNCIFFGHRIKAYLFP